MKDVSVCPLFVCAFQQPSVVVIVLSCVTGQYTHPSEPLGHTSKAFIDYLITPGTIELAFMTVQ